VSALSDQEDQVGWSDWWRLLRSEQAFARWCVREWQTHISHRQDGSIEPHESRIPVELRGDFLRYLECRVEEALAMPMNPESTEQHSPLAKQWQFDRLERMPELDPAQRMRRDFAAEFERYPHVMDLITKLGEWGVYQAADLSERERVLCDLHFLMGMSLTKCAQYMGLGREQTWWLVRSARGKFVDLLNEPRFAQIAIRRYWKPDAAS
jgi:predicted DNA-binding protein (UPF0251 family)